MKWTRARWTSVAGRPLGRLGWLILLGIVAAAPAWLFFSPTEPISLSPLSAYRLHRDDFEYLGRSRSLYHTIASLFQPHNTHVVPAWRVVTWGMVAAAGKISRFPDVLAIASYAILVAVMLLMGRLVARETARPALSVAAMILTGTTSLMLSAASWYSAGQTLWAGFGILAMLSYLRRWRRRRSLISLILAGVAAMVAGWLWTVGHVAGLVGAAYLLADRRPASRRAAFVPLLASAAAVAITFVAARGSVRIETAAPAKGGGTAISLRSGVSHTLQAIPETLILGNLGLIAETSPSQGALLTLGLVLLWAWSRRRVIDDPAAPSPMIPRPNPLEAAGATTVVSAYLLEWTFRGYLPFSSLRWQAPWYDTIPQIGAVLFASGWCSALLDARESAGAEPALKVRRVTRGQAVALAAFAVMLVIVNRPRVDEKWHYLAPAMLPSERTKFPSYLREQRDNYLFQDQAAWQRRHLLKLERAEAIAKARGIGREAIREAFGRLDAPLIPGVYDAAGLLDLPDRGSAVDSAARMALMPLLQVEPEGRPPWLERDEPWPPPIGDDAAARR